MPVESGPEGPVSSDAQYNRALLASSPDFGRHDPPNPTVKVELPLFH